MADEITAAERWSSRKTATGSSKGSTVEYIIQGTDDDIAALEELLSACPDTWNEVPRSGRSVEQIADKIWIGTVTYGYGSKNTEDIEYNFDTGGGTQKITQTISPLTVRSYGTQPPDFKGAINVDDNSVNGIDIIDRIINFSQTRQVSLDLINDGFKSAIFTLVSKVNNAPWHGFAAGEVLFMGASGSRHSRTGDVELTYKFAASPNKSNITIGSISGIEKKGWEYLWVRYEKSTDQNCLIQIPRAVYVHQVYEMGSFTALGLGD